MEDFDDSPDSNKRSLRLFNTLDRLDRDRSQIRLITELLGTIDAEAMEILTRAVTCLTNIAKIVESLKYDYLQTPSMLIINWHELEISSGQNMASWLKSISTRLEQFIELSRFFIQ
jgi:hypothetical protein